MKYELKHAGGPKWWAVDEDGEQIESFSGKKDDVVAAFNAWVEQQTGGGSVDGTVVESDTANETPAQPEPSLPDPSKLTGRAKTAALNAQVNTVFVANEYQLESGIQNEANRVHNVPEGWQAAWATPVQFDGGRHAQYLRERGYRPVYADEMGSDMYGDEIFVAYTDSTDSEFVFMGGAQLFIGPSERLEKIRKAEYDNRMAVLNTKQEETRDVAAPIGGELKTTRDSSTYNPMGG